MGSAQAVTTGQRGAGCYPAEPVLGWGMSQVAPSTCPTCGAAAYIGLNEVECTSPTCKNFSPSTQELHEAEMRPASPLTRSLPVPEGISLADEVLGLQWENDDTPTAQARPWRDADGNVDLVQQGAYGSPWRLAYEEDNFTYLRNIGGDKAVFSHPDTGALLLGRAFVFDGDFHIIVSLDRFAGTVTGQRR